MPRPEWINDIFVLISPVLTAIQAHDADISQNYPDVYDGYQKLNAAYKKLEVFFPQTNIDDGSGE